MLAQSDSIRQLPRECHWCLVRPIGCNTQREQHAVPEIEALNGGFLAVLIRYAGLMMAPSRKCGGETP